MNPYLQLIIDKSNKETKYLKYYINIINKAIVRIDQNLSYKTQHNTAKEIIGYSERHHILPRSFCFDKNQILDRFNIVRLTAREHLIVHLLLAKIFGGHMWKAADAMVTGWGSNINDREKYKLSSRLYETIREGVAINQSSLFKGKILSAEHRAKLSKASKGKRKSKEQIDKMVASRKANGSYDTAWNSGLTGVQESWNKGLTKETDSRLVDIGESISKAKTGIPSKTKGLATGQAPWNKGLSKETDERLKNAGQKIAKTKQLNSILDN